MTPTDTQQQESERFTPETLDALMEGASSLQWYADDDTLFIDFPDGLASNEIIFETDDAFGDAKLAAAAPSLAAQLKDALERERVLRGALAKMLGEYAPSSAIKNAAAVQARQALGGDNE